tara:strand:- start:307 stop:1296 length:990 start_codon:yes stop_codon:yes gene_type:complete
MTSTVPLQFRTSILSNNREIPNLRAAFGPPFLFIATLFLLNLKMILSYKNSFIFFKPIKTAGTSVEAAISSWCGDKDVFTGSLILNEISDKRYDLSPRNNFREEVILTGEEAKNYLKTNGRMDLWELGYKKFKVVDDIIYHEHTTPKMFCYDKDTENFLKISMVRNPFDMMVSYFWWSYYSPVDSVISFNAGRKISKKEERKQSKNIPKIDDTVSELQKKFDIWMNSAAFMEKQPKQCMGNLTVAEWFADWSNEFFNSEYVDFYIKFESLEKDFYKLCELLNKEVVSIPRFKNSIRKSKISYTDYYTQKNKETVNRLFNTAIEKFQYSF